MDKKYVIGSLKNDQINDPDQMLKELYFAQISGRSCDTNVVINVYAYIQFVFYLFFPEGRGGVCSICEGGMRLSAAVSVCMQ